MEHECKFFDVLYRDKSPSEVGWLCTCGKRVIASNQGEAFHLSDLHFKEEREKA